MKNNNKNKIILGILVVWAIAASVLSFYFWKTNQKTKTINNYLLETLIEANNLVKNSSSAYQVFGDCVTNSNTCNIQETERKLKELNIGKDSINKNIQEIQTKLQPFLQK